jgi:hypothetical protein
MSYFIFGLIDVLQPGSEEAVRSCAVAVGLILKLRSERGQPLLDEMLGTYSPLTSAPFLLTRGAADDTSDSLISPLAVGLDASVQAFAAIGRWLVMALDRSEIERIRVWMTEGYDSEFGHVEVPADRFAEELAWRVRAAGDVPSLNVWVTK